MLEHGCERGIELGSQFTLLLPHMVMSPPAFLRHSTGLTVMLTAIFAHTHRDPLRSCRSSLDNFSFLSHSLCLLQHLLSRVRRARLPRQIDLIRDAKSQRLGRRCCESTRLSLVDLSREHAEMFCTPGAGKFETGRAANRVEQGSRKVFRNGTLAQTLVLNIASSTTR